MGEDELAASTAEWIIRELDEKGMRTDLGRSPGYGAVRRICEWIIAKQEEEEVKDPVEEEAKKEYEQKNGEGSWAQLSRRKKYEILLDVQERYES